MLIPSMHYEPTPPLTVKVLRTISLNEIAVLANVHLESFSKVNPPLVPVGAAARKRGYRTATCASGGRVRLGLVTLAKTPRLPRPPRHSTCRDVVHDALHEARRADVGS